MKGLLLLFVLTCWSVLIFGSGVNYENQTVFRKKGKSQQPLNLITEGKFGNCKVGRLRVARQAPKRKYSTARIKYTVNGDSSYNLQLITLELLIAGDIELNPGGGTDSREENLKEIDIRRKV